MTTTLKLIPLDDVVVFPGMPVTLPAEVGGDSRVLLVPRRDAGYATVGVVAEVSERVALGGRHLATLIRSIAACLAPRTPTRTACCASRSTNATTWRRRRA